MRTIRQYPALIPCVLVTLAVMLAGSGAFGALANSAWPMFRHDLKHTAVSPYPAPTPSGTPWNYYIGGSLLSSCAIAPDGTVYTTGANSLYAINADGTFKWQRSIGTGSHRSTPAVGSDGVVYVGSLDNKLYAINSNGTQKWAFTTGNDITSSPAIGTDGTVYVGSRDGYLYAINPTGTQKWRRSVGDCHMTSPAVGADGTIYIGAAKMSAVNPDGTIKWQYTAGGNFSASPAITPDGTRVYCSSLDLNLYCFNASTGAKIWNFPLIQLAGSTPSSPAIGPDGTVYIGSNDNKLFAVNPDGTEKWHYTNGSDVRSSPAVSADGTIYFGAWDGFLYALNPNGTKKWWFLTKGSIFASPAIDAAGSVCIPSWDGYVHGNLNHNMPTTTPPANLQATVLSESSVRLDWTDMSSDEFGFRVEKMLPGGSFQFVANVGSNVQTYTVTGLGSGQAYTFTVAAYQEGGFAYSNEVTVTTMGQPAPSALTASTISGSEIDLTWNDNSTDETCFVIERKAGNVGFFREIETVGPNVTSYTDTSVNPAQDYYYRVRAGSATTYSTYSNEAWTPSSGREFGEISTVSTTRHQMCLTFDAGTDRVRTGILDILRQYGVHCTFFVTGEVAQLTPGFWETATNDGHQICNHSWDHPKFTDISDELIRTQMTDCDEMVYSITGNRTRPFFRAPYGARDPRVLADAANLGYRHVYWTTDTGDASWLAPASEIIQRTLDSARDGAVILYHCTLETTETAIATIVPELLNRGYELVTVGELVAPSQVATTVPAGWNLMSVPIEPAHPTPPVVFKGAAIDGNLYSWESETQGMGIYDAMTGPAFGAISADYGYWLNSPAPATLSISGRLQTTPRTIMLPHALPNPYDAWTIIGYPFLTAQGWGNCMVYNPNAPEPKTRSLAEARDAGWVNSLLYGWDPSTQGLYFVGLEDDWEPITILEPWHGYWMRTYADDLRLIIPTP